MSEDETENETVTDWQGEEIPACDAIEITIGTHQGSFIDISDVARCEDGDDSVFPEADTRGTGYEFCATSETFRPLDDLMMPNCGVYEGEFVPADEIHSTDCDSLWWWSGEDPPDCVVFVEPCYHYPLDDCSYCDHCDRWRLDCEGPCDCRDETSEVLPYGSADDYVRDLRDGCFYGIGFEVEKNECQGATDEGDSIETHEPFFACWESDSSCGIEGVSHIFPLSTRGIEVISQATKGCASDLAEPAGMDCGGHVTISGPGIRMDSIRARMGLIYALYPKRLRRSHCDENKRIKPWLNDKYSPVNHKGRDIYEIRLPSAVRSRGTLLWRYRLFLAMAQSIQWGTPFRAFLHDCIPLLKDRYGDEWRKVAKQALRFQAYLDSDCQRAHKSIREFVPSIGLTDVFQWRATVSDFCESRRANWEDAFSCPMSGAKIGSAKRRNKRKEEKRAKREKLAFRSGRRVVIQASAIAS